MVQPLTEGRIALEPGERQAQMLCELLRGAERIVRIFSDRLDPALFDNEGVAGELSRLVRSSRQCEVRILIKDSEMLVKRPHRLGALHRRLVSSVQIRKLTDFPEHYLTNYVLVDEHGVFLIPMQDDKICFVNHEDRPLVKHYIEQFDPLWARSGPDTELRSMAI